MTDQYKQKGELVAELEKARQRIAELESEKAWRERAENVLRKNAEFLRGILDTSASGVFVADREGTIVFANARMEELKRGDLDTLVGTSCLAENWDLRDFNGRPITREQDPFIRVRDNGDRVFALPVAAPDIDGRLRLFLISVAPLKDRDGTVSHVVFSLQDITEQKHAEEAYRVLVEDSPQGFSLSQDEKIVYANPALVEMLGCGQEGFVGQSPGDASKVHIHPEDQEIFMEAYRAVAQSARPGPPVTYRIIRPDGTLRYLESHISVSHFDGRPAIQIINIDVTKREEAEKALRDTRQNLQELFNRLDEFVFVLTPDGRIAHVNPAVVNRLGYTEEQLIGATVDVMHPPERRWEAREIMGAILAGKRTTCEIPIQTAKGELVPVETRVSRGIWDGREVFYGVSRDISERLEAEKKIREGERRFTEALKASSHILYRFNMSENRYDYVSPHVEKFTGYPYEEFLHRGLGDLVKETHPDDFNRMQRAIKEAVDNATGSTANLTVEVRRKLKDGGYRWWSDSMMLLLDANGSVDAIVGSVHDIEDRKRAEEALRESETRARLLAENSADMISRHAPDGTVLYVSPACEALSGYTHEELLGKPAEFLVHPDDVGKVWSDIQKQPDAGRYVTRHRMPRKDGSTIWVETTGRLLRDASGNVTEIQCAIRDISDRIQAEEAIRQKQQYLTKLLQTAPVIMFTADLDGVCTFFEGRGLLQLGIDPEKYIGTSMLEYYADRPDMKAWLERAIAGEDFSVEYFHEPSGRTLVGHAAQLYDAEGNREGVVVVSVDITEQTNARDAVNKAHAMLLSFAEHFPGLMFMKDTSSRLLFANREMRELFDVDSRIGKRADEFMPPDIASRILADDQAALAGGPLLIEEALIDKHGRERFWRTWKFPIKLENGPTFLAGIAYDITGQRQAEMAYQALVESSLQGLGLLREGRIIFVNEHGARITGYTRDELLAFTPDDVFTKVLPADHAQVLDRYRRRQCGEELPPLFHMRIIRKDGAVRTLLFSTTAIDYQGEHVIQAAFLDVTDFPEATQGSA